jgi:hypothetical protein
MSTGAGIFLVSPAVGGVAVARSFFAMSPHGLSGFFAFGFTQTSIAVFVEAFEHFLAEALTAVSLPLSVPTPRLCGLVIVGTIVSRGRS